MSITEENVKLQKQGARLFDKTLELADENAKLREQLDWERSENGWMREFNDRMAEHCGTKDCPSLVAYVNKIETENVKLRELVDELYPLADYGAMDASELDRAHDLMHELGIEVDE
jgi:hypothetical protein